MGRKIFTTLVVILTLSSVAMAEDFPPPPTTEVLIFLTIDKIPVDKSRISVTVSERTGGGFPVVWPVDPTIDENGAISAVITPAGDSGDKLYTFSIRAVSEKPMLCHFIDCEKAKMPSVIWMLQKLVGIR